MIGEMSECQVLQLMRFEVFLSIKARGRLEKMHLPDWSTKLSQS